MLGLSENLPQRCFLCGGQSDIALEVAGSDSLPTSPSLEFDVAVAARLFRLETRIYRPG